MSKRTNSSKGTAKAITNKPKGQVSTSRKRDQQLHQEMAAVTPATPTRFPKEATPAQRMAAKQMAQGMVDTYRYCEPLAHGELPPLADPKWRKIFLEIIEGVLRPKDLTDAIEGVCGARTAEMADAMIESSEGTATLGDLFNELEQALDSLQGLIDEHGETALLITPHDADDQD